MLYQDYISKAVGIILSRRRLLRGYAITLAMQLFFTVSSASESVVPDPDEVVPVAIHAISVFLPEVPLGDLMNPEIRYHYEIAPSDQRLSEWIYIRFQLFSEERRSTMENREIVSGRAISVKIHKDREIRREDVTNLPTRSESTRINEIQDNLTKARVDPKLILKSKLPRPNMSSIRTPNKDRFTFQALDIIRDSMPEIEVSNLVIQCITSGSLMGVDYSVTDAFYGVRFLMKDTLVKTVINEKELITGEGVSVLFATFRGENLVVHDRLQIDETMVIFSQSKRIITVSRGFNRDAKIELNEDERKSETITQ